MPAPTPLVEPIPVSGDAPTCYGQPQAPQHMRPNGRMIPVRRMETDAKQWGFSENPEKGLVPQQADLPSPGGPDAVDHASGGKRRSVFQIDHRTNPGRVGEAFLTYGPFRVGSQKPCRGNESPERDSASIKRLFATPQEFRGLGKRKIMKFPLTRRVMARDQACCHPLTLLRCPEMVITVEHGFMPLGDLFPEPGRERGILIDPTPMVMIRYHQQGGERHPHPGKIIQHGGDL